jgi:hypothetical protein
MSRPHLLGGLLSAALLAGLSPAPAARAEDGPPVAAKDAKEGDKKKKKEKKPASPAPRRVYTDEDLKDYREGRAGQNAQPQSATAPGNETSDAPAETAAPAEEEHGGRQVWADRAMSARERVGNAETRVEQLEARIAALRTDRGAERAMDPFRLQTIEAEIAKATAELDEARKELRSAREAQEALREEARRKGVPPGWLDQP